MKRNPTPSLSSRLRAIADGLAGPVTADMQHKADLTANTFIAGFAKSGTTSLHDWLSAHPDVDAAHPKEPKFYGRHFIRGWDWYAEHFSSAGAAPIRLDASTRYASRIGEFAFAPHLIQKFAPHARFIFLARDPLARLASHIQHMAGNRARRGRPFPLADIMKEETGELLISGSLFDAHVAAYEARFPGATLVVQFERLVRAPQEEGRRICAHLGIDPAGLPASLPKENVAGAGGRAKTAAPNLALPELAEGVKRIRADARQFAETHEAVDPSLWPTLAEEN